MAIAQRFVVTNASRALTTNPGEFDVKVVIDVTSLTKYGDNSRTVATHCNGRLMTGTFQISNNSLSSSDLYISTISTAAHRAACTTFYTYMDFVTKLSIFTQCRSMLFRTFRFINSICSLANRAVPNSYFRLFDRIRIVRFTIRSNTNRIRIVMTSDVAMVQQHYVILTTCIGLNCRQPCSHPSRTPKK